MPTPIGSAGNTSPIQYPPESSTSNAHQSPATANLVPTPNTAGSQLSGLQAFSRKRSISSDAESPEKKRSQVASPTIKQEVKSEQKDPRSSLPVELRGKTFPNIKEAAEHELNEGWRWDAHSSASLRADLKSVKEDGSYDVCAKILSGLNVNFKHPDGIPDPTTGTNKDLIDRSGISAANKTKVRHLGRWLEQNKNTSLSELLNSTSTERNYQVRSWQSDRENPYGNGSDSAVNAFLRAFGKND